MCNVMTNYISYFKSIWKYFPKDANNFWKVRGNVSVTAQ